jgi:RNA polymerase sigma-70 factor (ECF subfamily)
MDNRPMAEIETLYQSHGDAILRYLHRTFGRAAPPEDLLQETFLQALRHAGHCTAAESPRAFLFGIARHVGLTAVRRAKVHRAAQADLAAESGREHDHGLADMQAAIEKLPPQIRETLELRLRDELTYAEIAAVLGTPVGTIRSRLHSALRLLQIALNPPDTK